MICPACGSENIEGIDRCENCLAPFRDLDVPRADAAEGWARSVMEDRLSQLEYDDTIVVSLDTPALEVAKRMKDARLGCALVLEHGELVGIFTEHDVLTKMFGMVQRSAAPQREPAVDMPITDVPFNDIPIEEIRTDEQLASEAGSETEWQTTRNTLVSELMSRNPETLYEGDSVAAALNKMSLGRYRHLPVKRSDGSYAVASIKSVLNYIGQEEW